MSKLKDQSELDLLNKFILYPFHSYLLNLFLAMVKYYEYGYKPAYNIGYDLSKNEDEMKGEPVCFP